MSKSLPIVLAAAASLSTAAGVTGAKVGGAAPADPVVTDGDKYRLVFENQRVRVLRYHDEPGAKTHLHHHPDFVLHALAPFRRRLTSPDGATRSRTFQAGDTIWVPAESHLGENVGDTPTDVLIVELKQTPGGK